MKNKAIILILFIILVCITSNPVFSVPNRISSGAGFTLNCTVKENVFQNELFCINKNCSINITGIDSMPSSSILGIIINKPLEYDFFRIVLDKKYQDTRLYGSCSEYPNSSCIVIAMPFIAAVVNGICDEQISSADQEKITFALEQRIFSKGIYAFMNQSIVMEPFSENRVREIDKKNNNFRECTRQDYALAGNWILLYREEEKPSVQPYCKFFIKLSLIGLFFCLLIIPLIIVLCVSKIVRTFLRFTYVHLIGSIVFITIFLTIAPSSFFLIFGIISIFGLYLCMYVIISFIMHFKKNKTA